MYVAESVQYKLFDQRDYLPQMKKVQVRFQLQNRRYLGNKYKLLKFIEKIVEVKCGEWQVFCDIFAGTGVVAQHFSAVNNTIIANDFLASNFATLKAFLGTHQANFEEICYKIDLLNAIKAKDDNYFSKNFGNTYFTVENARKIGAIREAIDKLSSNKSEKMLLITSLLYAVDKVANTVGHYDAFRKTLNTVQPLRLLLPDIDPQKNRANEVYNEDANQLIRKIYCDVLYIDPPYNSRQYSDTYHLLENLTTWNKPNLHGKAKKMNRSHIKSNYCLQSAPQAFADLIKNAHCKHILLSYNNTGVTKDGRSNARIRDEQIIRILSMRGNVDVFEQNHKPFATGKSEIAGNTERIFYCRVMN